MPAVAKPVTRAKGCTTWTDQEGDRYLIVGLDRSGRRFRSVYDNWTLAAAINVYRGRVWLLRDGKRYLIRSTYN